MLNHVGDYLSHIIPCLLMNIFFLNMYPWWLYWETYFSMAVESIFRLTRYMKSMSQLLFNWGLWITSQAGMSFRAQAQHWLRWWEANLGIITEHYLEYNVLYIFYILYYIHCILYYIILYYIIYILYYIILFYYILYTIYNIYYIL